MDSAQLTRDVLGWDVRSWAPAFRFWDGIVDTAPPVLRCLEIGAGPGGPSLWLALKGHDVICSNRENTEAMASALHEQYGLAGRIAYEDIDATNIPYENEFDVIVFKSVLGGVGAFGGPELVQVAVDQMFAALKPGGRLIYAENLRATPIHRAARALAYRLRRSAWRFVSIRELTNFLSRFRDHQLHTTGVLAVFGLTEGQRNALAAADDRILNRVAPRGWKYVAYGVATKP